jgi:sarcosine oxidase
MKNVFDVIVLGVGSMGSATCFQLASKGHSVLGIEQFDIPHDQGSHAGQSRIIRKAYFEHPDYVPLLERAYENWKHLEAVTNTQVYFPTGLLYAGMKNSILIEGVKQSASKYNLQVESLSQEVCRNRFPQFCMPEEYEVLFEPDAGFLTPERVILLYTQHAIKAGATIHTKEKVLEWHKDAEGIIVTTHQDSYRCKKLVITAGPWADECIPGLASKLKVTRQVIMWSIPESWDVFQQEKFPCWMVDDHQQPGMFYGFPALPVGTFGAPIGLKAAHHFPGETTFANHVNRKVSAGEEQHLVTALKSYVPQGYSSTHTLKTCLYTNTPDEHFIIDFLPGYNQDVAIAAGFSGHGFKFASVVGEIMADLATRGATNLPIGFLSLNRFN